MEIGGYDLIYTSQFPVQSHQLVDICRATWPTLVVEFDPEPGHFYVYRDMDAAVAWHSRGNDDSAPMIYFILGDMDFTAVVGELDEPGQKQVVANLDKVFDRQKA